MLKVPAETDALRHSCAFSAEGAATARVQRHNNVIALGDLPDNITHRLYYAGALMTEHHRYRQLTRRFRIAMCAWTFMHPPGGVTGGGRATAVKICSDIGIDFYGVSR
jgi:hypothetical protein